MINFILVSHGQMAAGIMNAAELISGKHKGVEIIGLKESDPIEELNQRVEKAILNLKDCSDGILIMVDLFGASPFNVSSLTSSKFENVDVITGLNLPMLLETLMQRESMTLTEIVSLAKQSGIDGIKVLSNLIK